MDPTPVYEVAEVSSNSSSPVKACLTQGRVRRQNKNKKQKTKNKKQKTKNKKKKKTKNKKQKKMKRPRRDPHLIDRFYKCIHPNCKKRYGTLSHLNTHIRTQGHGKIRSPEEFTLQRKERKKMKSNKKGLDLQKSEDQLSNDLNISMESGSSDSD